MRKRLSLLSMGLAVALLAFVWGASQGQAAPFLNPAVDLTKPNFAYSPPLRKFIDSLPGLTSAGSNSLGQYIPIAQAQTLAGFPNDDYYEIALVEYREQMHPDLPPVIGTWPNQTGGGTLLRGYIQEINGVPVGTPHYLGPLIIATKNRPVRIKFTNRLPLTASGGDLFLPVDTTLMGAGMGPLDASGNTCDPAEPGAMCANYTQNRATIHLHGGIPPWISDGTAHQWIAPVGEATPFLKGASQQNVPDMPVPSQGSATFYWTNQQGGRLMFYHDHALGITGLNVYAGEAAGYLLVDPVEEASLTGAGVPTDLGHLLPLVIQDKTFVYDASVTPVGVAKDSTRYTTYTDPNWTWAPGGNLWFPHVYVPNQDPNDLSGANPLGRWDYGPWFWPVFPVASPYPPAVSHVPEAFMDTPIVNGAAYPYVNVAAAPYRLRILNAMNDRMVNLQMYVADSGFTTAATATALVSNGSISTITLLTGGAGYTPNSSPMVHIVGGGGFGAWATATVDGAGVVNNITLTNRGAAYTAAPTIYIGGDTEVKMVPAMLGTTSPFPDSWLAQTTGMIPDILDGRTSGVPDPSMRGPAMIQIGTEGGILPGPVLLPNVPVGFEQNKRNIVVLNVLEKTLFMAPAERADIIVDFSKFSGKTIILYNDSPAPVPAGDPRYDFYTGDPDYSETGGANYQGGAPSTLPGYGPNTRTIMQFRVAAGGDSSAPVDDYDPTLLANLTTALPTIFTASQDAPVVPESVYNGLLYSGGSTTDTFARISDHYLTFTPYSSATATTIAMKNKTIQELFDTQGRMNATLGVELPFTGALIQTTVPLGFIDPVTETIPDGETQIWKITHNGVDTHGIHFHLVNVQVINRVGWDGAIREIDENERGWKDTVRMNPLEDIIVAMRGKTPSVPFAVPDSIRLLDPTMPEGSTFPSLDPITGAPVTVTNSMFNFGWEYTWHCHILGHEENDMMRAIVSQVAPLAPSGLLASNNGGLTAVDLAWQDNAASEYGFTIQRADDSGFTSGVISFVTGSSIPNTSVGTTMLYSDATVTLPGLYYYRVQAFSPNGISAWSNIAANANVPIAVVAPTIVSFGSVTLNTTSAAQNVILSNVGNALMTVGTITTTGDFAQTNTCSTLASGASCTISVTFKPTVMGAKSGVLSIPSDGSFSPLTVSLNGTGITPVASVLPTSLAFSPPNQLVGTISAAKTLTLSNTGNAPMTSISASITGTNFGDFAISATTCGTTLAAGANCTISVTFAPTAPGARTATITINSSDPANPALNVALTGTGFTAPIAGVAPTFLSFGTVTLNSTTAPLTATLSNTGNANLTSIVIGLTGVNAADYAISSTTCGATLVPAASCTISVTFRPTALGARAASISISSNNSVSPITVSLTGAGAGSIAGLAPASLTYGIQVLATTSPAQTVTLSNTGNLPLTGILFGISGNAGDFSISASTCGATLAAGANCTASVTFTPTAAGARAATLTVGSNDPVHPTLSVSLSGTGTAVSLSPAAISFGNQTVGTASASRSATLINTGTTVLTINGIAITGANPADFTMSTTCGATLNAGRSCSISVRFRPSALGLRTAAISVRDSDPTGTQTVALSGTGAGSVAVVSPTTVAFGSVIRGQAGTPRTITVSNTGNMPMTFNTLNAFTLGGLNANQFTLATGGSCVNGGTLAGGASCTVTVNFKPGLNTTLGAKSAILSVRDNATNSRTQTAALSGTAQ